MGNYVLLELVALLLAAGCGVAGFYVGHAPISQCRYELCEAVRLSGKCSNLATETRP